MNWARSTTTLEDGATLVISSNTTLLLEYFLLIYYHFSIKPSCLDWNNRLVYCLPRILGVYTSNDSQKLYVFEGHVEGTYVLPVYIELTQGIRIKYGIEKCTVNGSHYGPQQWLGGESGHNVHCRIHFAGSRVGGRDNGSNTFTHCIMGMNMQGHVGKIFP